MSNRSVAIFKRFFGRRHNPATSATTPLHLIALDDPQPTTMSTPCDAAPLTSDREPVVSDSTASSSIRSVVIAEPPPPPPPPPPQPTFRFLDLPPEIRRIVYKQLFGGSYLELEERPCSCSDSTRASVFWSGRLPGVLTASKLIREEALPIFSACLTPVTYDLFPSTAAAEIPAHYLKGCKVALIDEQSYGLLDTTQLPSLNELRVHLCWDPECLGGPQESDLDVTDEDVLNGIMKHYETMNVHYVLKDAKEKGTLPVRTVIETQVEVVCNSCDTYGWWRVSTYFLMANSGTNGNRIF